VQFEVTNPHTEKTYRIQVSHEKEVNPSEPEFVMFLLNFMLKDIVQSRHGPFGEKCRWILSDPSSEECPHSVASEFSSQEVRLFLPQMTIKSKEKIEIWPGFRFSIRPIEGIPMVCLDSDQLVVRLETVLDSINEIKKDLQLATKVE
jgi:hypothetical protein